MGPAKEKKKETDGKTSLNVPGVKSIAGHGHARNQQSAGINGEKSRSAAERITRPLLFPRESIPPGPAGWALPGAAFHRLLLFARTFSRRGERSAGPPVSAWLFAFPSGCAQQTARGEAGGCGARRFILRCERLLLPVITL